MKNFDHKSVLLQETVDLLVWNVSGTYIDGTLGLGGHSFEILSRIDSSGFLYGFDKDLENLEHAVEKLSVFTNFEAVNSGFETIKESLRERKIDSVDGILVDLGLCSTHLDNPERGFSFMQSGPLDMRFDVDQRLSAATIVNEYSEEDLVKILREYGEEKFSHRIAREIVKVREEKVFKTTDELKELVENVYGYAHKKGRHVATQTFQAFRIAVNDELKVLEDFLEDSYEVLKPNGVFVCISYHSLEDRIVKKFMKKLEEGDLTDEERLLGRYEDKSKIEILTKKLVTPTMEEIETNSRARSAKLRAYKKLPLNH